MVKFKSKTGWLGRICPIPVIKPYLHRWGTWWVRTSETWGYQDLLVWFLEVCRDPVPAAYAAGLYWHDVKKSRIEANHDRHPVVELDLPAAA